MKKYTTLLFTLILFITFTSCKNPPIFATIEQEVKLKKFSVAGSILGFAQIGDDIYVANPAAVYTKKKDSTGGWSSIGNVGGFTSALLSDGTNLFASLVDGGVYKYNKATKKWDLISDSEKCTAIYGSGSNILAYAHDTKPNPSAGEKPINIYPIYTITTGGATEIATIKELDEDDNLQDVDNIKQYPVGAARRDAISYFATKSRVYSFSGSSATEEKLGKKISDIKTMCEGPGSTVFILTGSTVYQYDGSTLKEKSLSIGGVKKAFFFKTASKKKLLIACDKGYTELTFTNDNLEDATETAPSSAQTNSTTAINAFEQYSSTLGSLSFDPIFAVETTGSDYAVYAGISAHPLRKKTGLWAYYSTTQEWNRE